MARQFRVLASPLELAIDGGRASLIERAIAFSEQTCDHISQVSFGNVGCQYSSSTTMTTPSNCAVNADLLAAYETLPLPESTTLVTYLWIDGCQGVRHKTKTIDFIPQNVSEVPVWSVGMDWFYNSSLPLGSELHAVPVKMYNDPFEGGHNKLVLVELWKYDGTLFEDNTRQACKEAIQAAAEHEPRFAISQVYGLLDGKDRRKPLGWPNGGNPGPEGLYYCGVGANQVYGRDLAEAHYKACMYAGVNISSQSAASVLSQWKFEIGPGDALSVADDLYVARFILERIAEDLFINVTFDPKMFPQHSKGTFVDFRTNNLADIDQIQEFIGRLRRDHSRHKLEFGIYPLDIARRLNISNDADSKQFVEPRVIVRDEGVCLRDIRPPSNMDPYTVCAQITKSICSL